MERDGGGLTKVDDKSWEREHILTISPAVSILTVLRATSNRTVAGTGDAIINVNGHLLQHHWSNLHHLRIIDYGWVITVFLLLLPFLTVGAAILLERSLHQRSLRSEPVVIASAPLDSRGTVKCRVPRMQTTDQPTFPTRRPIEAGSLIPDATPTSLQKAQGKFSPRSSVEVPKTTGLVGSSKEIVDLPVALKQPHRIIAWITLCSVEGFLSLDPCSPNSECDDAIQWTITFHPQDRHCPTRSPTHPNADVTTNERLLNILYHGISAYHPWAPQFAGVLKIPGDIVNWSNNDVGLDATAIVPRTTQEDRRAAYAKGENEPETHQRRKKPHRGGQRAARMKRGQALREAPEAPEAGPSGPN
ncbi:hypothetical protein M407DRAFT_229803 [Tulasnella calospora MUT 4182]|uniref:Uncharacterized protein n=1 Tax=Tulasnella calospora MUT 4182 TaxID=1051891 RepID=A0A0C3QW01_9AGAM|nr:hypothetical protein M407DRAFT_229803 [Tulasnella calospora MUT 4182]